MIFHAQQRQQQIPLPCFEAQGSFEDTGFIYNLINCILQANILNISQGGGVFWFSAQRQTVLNPLIHFLYLYFYSSQSYNSISASFCALLLS
jgi:hypothetical protein